MFRSSSRIAEGDVFPEVYEAQPEQVESGSAAQVAAEIFEDALDDFSYKGNNSSYDGDSNHDQISNHDEDVQGAWKSFEMAGKTFEEVSSFQDDIEPQSLQESVQDAEVESMSYAQVASHPNPNAGQSIIQPSSNRFDSKKLPRNDKDMQKIYAQQLKELRDMGFTHPDHQLIDLLDECELSIEMVVSKLTGN